MTKLLQKHFIGISMKDINNYIETINEYLNERIRKGVNWASAVKNLSTYLNEHDFVQHEGIAINDETIDKFISRLMEKMTPEYFNKMNFLSFNKEMTNKRPVIPNFINSIEALNDMRNRSYASLDEQGFKKKDLGKAINDMAFYREQMAAINPPKKQKQNKYGNVGMDDLVKIVSKLKQDVKQIRDTQSVVSANEWINRHKYNDLYEAVGKDLDGDGTPEVVVQTIKDKKPVIVNGFTTVPSMFPYRNSYYSAYPSVDARKEAHKAGINLRKYVNNIYNPEYDETGRKVVNYTGEGWNIFENAIKAAGIDEKHLIKPTKRSSYQAFVSRCISPIYHAVRYINNAKLPFTLTAMASVIWNQFALLPAMHYVYGGSVQNVSDDQWKNLRNKKPVKQAIDQIVHDYLVNPVKIADFVPTVCEMCNQSGLPVQPEHIPLVTKATFIIIEQGIDVLPPDPSQFAEWFNQTYPNHTPAIQNEQQEATPKVEEVFD